MFLNCIGPIQLKNMFIYDRHVSKCVLNLMRGIYIHKYRPLSKILTIYSVNISNQRCDLPSSHEQL